ncbi:MAG: RagB/SusD family nutrient uptake outer membrane protein [Bacteroidaceae bacterium]|nr:RagB/SusD family nutrient uptake outer membrane protein [Bacteroidaceae bacterium]
MKSLIKNISFCTCLAAGFVMSSCDDFLTITPTDKIVEEEFWQDKNDLTNSVYACYKRMTNYDLLNAYLTWGEIRSDNFERSTTTGSTGQVANIMNANLLSTYNAFNWTSAYNCINYCNKILAHGPEILANDESFSEGDWTPIRAEIIALRAFNHFYLVRTFGEIPYVTKDYNNDSEELRQTQETQLTVLNNIIDDLESVKDQAMSDYGKTVLNKGRLTKKAIYTLLADVYLWRASYKAGNCHPFVNRTIPSYNDLYVDKVPYVAETYKTTAEADYKKCVECCDKVIDIAKAEYIKKMKESGEAIGGVVEFELGDLLAQNVNKTGTLNQTSAYTKIFGTGNSDESIFELQFDGTTYGNGVVTGLYFQVTNAKQGQYQAASALIEGNLTSPNTILPNLLYTKTDYRLWDYLQVPTTGNGTPEGTIIKFVSRENHQYKTRSTTTVMEDNMSTTKCYATQLLRSSSNMDANWIFYRMSEVFLMKAEAMSQLYTDPEDLKEGFKYVREVFKRSNPFAYSPSNAAAKDDSLKFDGNFDTQKGLEMLVMAERQRELYGEGKRWFDLVRLAQRRGSTEDMLTLLTRKYATNRKSIQAKLADMQSLFSPVYENELKSNTWLYQNGAWENNSSSGRTDNL